MFKLIIAGLIFGIFFLLLRQFRRHQNTKKINRKQQQAHIDISRCAYCGVHIPKNEAIFRDNTSYCCHEHADQQ